MRVSINLATQPYEDTRQFYARWRTTLGGVGIVVALLVAYAVYTGLDARSAARDVARLRQQQAALEQQRRRAQDIMNQPQNRDVRESSQVLNDVIARKAFSWTLVLADLEKIVPPRVHVVSIHPELKESQLILTMKVEGQSHDSVVQLLRQMEASERFRQAQLNSETVATRQEGGAAPPVVFDISAVYVPAIPGTAAAATSGGGE